MEMTRVPPGPGSAPSPIAAGGLAALVADLPAPLRNLPVGTVIGGVVLGRNDQGVLLVQTLAGLLALRTAAVLAPGTRVTIQLQSAGAQTRAIILAATPPAVPPADARGPAPAGPSGPVPSAPPAQAPAAPDTVVTGAGRPLAAVVIARLPMADQPAPAGLAPAPAVRPGPEAPPARPLDGARTETIAAPQPLPAAPPTAAGQAAAPGAGAAMAAAPASPEASISALQAFVTGAARALLPALAHPTAAGERAPAPVPPPMAADQAPLRPALADGTRIEIRVLPLPAAAPDAHETPAGPTPRPVRAQPHPQAAAPGVPASPTVVVATLVARTPAGVSILETPLARLAVSLPGEMSALAPGARLLLEAAVPAEPAAAGAALPPAAPLARRWPEMQEMIRILQASGDPRIQEALARLLPRPGPRLAAQLAGFLAAAEGGLREWLGDSAAQAVAARGLGGRLDAADREARERAAQEGKGAEWTLSIIPFVDGAHLRQLRLFARRRRTGQGGRPQRFMLESEHDELGPFQLDGTLHDRRLTLVLRTHDELPPPMPQEIERLYADACEGTGLTGRISFEAVESFPGPSDCDPPGAVLQVSV